jgi:hypothetical protein
MRIRATAATAALLCAASLGSAQAAEPGKFTMYGSGSASCGDWLAARTEQSDVRHQVQLAWVLGFLSAAGGYDVRGDLRHTDSHAIAAWVDKYCRDNPLDIVAVGARHLVDELSKPQ